MRKLIAFFLLAALPVISSAQSRPVVIDSFKNLLKTEVSPEKRIAVTSNIALLLIYVDLAESDKYGQEAIEIAEATRNRKLMAKALLMNGRRYSYLGGRKDNIEKSVLYYNKALALARANKLDEEMVYSYIGLSAVTRLVPDAEKALTYCNQAYSYVNSVKDDSLTAEIHLEYGSVYLQKHEKLLSLRNYLTALRIAEELKNSVLLRSAYSALSFFYDNIEDYDRAIDYTTKATEMLNNIRTGQAPYNRVQDYNRIGTLYSNKKSYDLAMRYFEKSIALADSLKFEPLKVMSYRSIVDNYLDNNQPLTALNYFNQHPQLRDFLQTLNFGHFIDQSYGYIYMQLGNYDSAKYFYNKVADLYEKDVSQGNQYSYYAQMGLLYKKTGEYDQSLSYFTRANEIAEKTGNLNGLSLMSLYLDSLYRLKGDYKQALVFSNLSHLYKDSLNNLSKEKELMQAEALDEQQRQTRQAEEMAVKVTRRHNIQYRIIIIGIVALIIALVMLGMFKVSATTIKMLGFFTFLMLFEFIFLVLKKQSHSLTEGEPWKDLVLMIVLAAVLLPLHHWLEHKVIHYLTSHNRLTASGKTLKQRLFKKNATPAK